MKYNWINQFFISFITSNFYMIIQNFSPMKILQFSIKTLDSTETCPSVIDMYKKSMPKYAKLIHIYSNIRGGIPMTNTTTQENLKRKDVYFPLGHVANDLFSLCELTQSTFIDSWWRRFPNVSRIWLKF